jgi:hypothetical protein
MRKILSERNFVIVLFVMAFVIFSLAQEDAKKVEKMYQGNTNASTLMPAPRQTAAIPETGNEENKEVKK